MADVMQPAGTTSSSLAVTDLSLDADLDLSQLTTLFPEPRIPGTTPGEGITTMDFYGADRKLSEMGDRDFTEFLDSDMFPPNTDSGSMDQFGLDSMTSMDNEWLDTFFDDPVLNDRMMSEALQPQRVQSEHSYSLCNGENGEDSPLNIKMETVIDRDLEPDLLVNPNMTMVTTSTELASVKQEPMDTTVSSTPSINSSTVTVTRTSTNSHTLLKQPTIILATQQGTSAIAATSSIATSVAAPTMLQSVMQLKNDQVVLPRVNIKVEPAGSPTPYQMSACSSSLPSPDSASTASSPEHNVYDSIGLPPTPPSSAGSDSEGGLSPQRSCPSSPIRGHTPLARHQQQLRAVSQPLFTTPIPTSGVLILTEEEKRTLIAEGYPIPNKLPLTKQEEKNLKKIRRKIKNKISAQESRRKKKEYMESLEKRMEAYSQENTDLKKKVDQLENNNRSLLSQLQKLQSLVSKVPRPSAATSTQTGTCLMVLVLFFAIFMGTWSPMTWSIGYGRILSTTTLTSAPNSNSILKVDSAAANSVMGPDVQDATVDAYSTPNMRSRVLLSIKEEGEEQEFGPHAPFSYKDLFIKFFSFAAANCHESGHMEGMPVEPLQPEVKVSDLDPVMATQDATYHPDTPQGGALSVDYTESVTTMAAGVNTTA